jgi:hypothetical protein
VSQKLGLDYDKADYQEAMHIIGLSAEERSHIEKCEKTGTASSLKVWRKKPTEKDNSNKKPKRDFKGNRMTSDALKSKSSKAIYNRTHTDKAAAMKGVSEVLRTLRM